MSHKDFSRSTTCAKMFDCAQKAQYMQGHREKFVRSVHLFEDTSVMFSQLFKALHIVSSLLSVVYAFKKKTAGRNLVFTISKHRLAFSVSFVVS
jgi:hypothetical protein